LKYARTLALIALTIAMLVAGIFIMTNIEGGVAFWFALPIAYALLFRLFHRPRRRDYPPSAFMKCKSCGFLYTGFVCPKCGATPSVSDKV